MLIATCLAGFGSYWSIKTGGYATEGYALLGIFTVAVIIGFFVKSKQSPSAESLEETWSE